MNNRIIKFRAWDKTDSVMYPVEQWANKCWVAVPIQTAEDEWHLEQRKLEDVELMQFTGLHDKNGKEIYEGDVLVMDKKVFGGMESPKVVVKFEDGAFQTNWNVYDVQHYCEVIGNIYENPNLLNQ